jgi:hypothetical protein
MTLPNRPLSWIENSTKRRATNRQAPESGARSAVGRHARMTVGRVAAATFGTRSTPEACAQPACTSGLRRSASRVCGGRRIQIGMRLREKQGTVK